MPNVFFHIGFPKTATTTLQDALMAHGPCAYLGKGLREAAPPSLSLAVTRAALYLDTRRFEAALPALRDAIAAEAAGARCLVISDEAFTFAEYMVMGEHWPRGRVTDHDVIAGRLARLAPGAGILVSLREQADFLQSYYRQRVKRQMEDAPIAEWMGRELDRLDGRSMLHTVRYDEMYDAYAAHFDPADIHVWVYEAYRGDFGAYLDEVSGVLGLDGAALRAEWGGRHANPDRVNRRNRASVMRLRGMVPEGLRAVLPTGLKSAVMDGLSKTPPDTRMPDETRRAIRAYFATPNHAFAERTGIDLASHGYAMPEG